MNRSFRPRSTDTDKNLLDRRTEVGRVEWQTPIAAVTGSKWHHAHAHVFEVDGRRDARGWYGGPHCLDQKVAFLRYCFVGAIRAPTPWYTSAGVRYAKDWWNRSWL
jgi:hypothetical protein